jgi:hypothetical protein
MALGMKLVTVSVYKMFKIVTILGKKYNKILSLVVKCLKHKEHWRFLEDGYRLVIVAAPFLKHVVFPKRMEVEVYRFLFDLETCQRGFMILSFVYVMKCQVGR